MTVSAARRIAFDVLRRVSLENAYAADLLFAALGFDIPRADAALATELTLGVLQWQRLLDFLLERHLERRCERLDLEVLLALRIGLYQLRYLDRVPPHAAINESVELVKRARKSSAASLVNAVLRKAVAQAKLERNELEKVLPERTAADERLAILYSHPTWLVSRWIRQFGRVRTTALLEANNRPSPTTCAVLEEAAAEILADSLRQCGFEVHPGRWLRGALQVSGGNPAGSEPYRTGEMNFQDEGSQMVAHLVQARESQNVLDLCAAPGGKTVLLARAVGAHGRVLAADIHEHRLRTIRDQMKRMAIANVELVGMDATRPLPWLSKFDRLLVDVPCSGTGTLSRNPEIRWKLRPEDLREAHRLQAAMLSHALDVASDHARLVYSTCSLEPEENENVVAEVFEQNPAWRLVSGEDALGPHLRDPAAANRFFADEGFFRTFPPEHGTDGFFAAVLERQKS